MSTIRQNLSYAYGYAQGRFASLPTTPSELYGQAVSKVTSFVALPIPLLSFLALPFFGGSSATVNLVVFYVTWSALVASHGPLTIELGGTLLVRLLCFLLPALSMLAFDSAVPGVAKGIKSQGERQLPLRLGRNKVLEIAGVAIFNVLLSVAVHAGLEHLATEWLYLRSLLKVTSIVPLPWTVLKDVVKGLVIRGSLSYAAHRYLLHTYRTPLKTLHHQWQHSVRLPFSLVAAYDHPINYLVSEWLPVFFPAYLFRFHVLTWHVLLAIVSLEELFVYSGYAVLPSTIILAGMARRTDAHFKSVTDRNEVGNFGHLGLLDYVCGTTCKGEVDVVDDLQSEAGKHQLQQRAEEAVQGAMSGLQKKNEPEERETDDHAQAKHASANHEPEADPDADFVADEDADDDQPQQTQRRSGRRTTRKA